MPQKLKVTVPATDEELAAARELRLNHRRAAKLQKTNISSNFVNKDGLKSNNERLTANS